MRVNAGSPALVLFLAMFYRKHLFSILLGVFLLGGCTEETPPDFMRAKPTSTSTIPVASTLLDFDIPNDARQPKWWASKNLLKVCSFARYSGPFLRSPELRQQHKTPAANAILAFEELRKRGIYSKRELDEISNGTLSPGLREQVIYCSWGVPDEKEPENAAPDQMEYFMYDTFTAWGKQTVFVKNGRIVRVETGDASGEVQRIQLKRRELKLKRNSAERIWAKDEVKKPTAGEVAAGIAVLPVYVLLCLSTGGVGC